jgi:hypothetical protein
MGKVFRAAKKVVKKVAKPITRVVKKVAKKVAKIGKAVMKGVSKVTSKLGPLGMIAMSIAMPYALAGLSSMTTAAMGYSQAGAFGNFIRAVGTVGNQIRTGYSAFNTFVGQATTSITKTIGDTFTRFAPKGVTNMFSNISQGAKNLYTASKNKLKSVMPKFKTAQPGTVEFYGAADPGIGIMESTDAVSSLAKGTLNPAELGKQTLTQDTGWFTRVNQAGVNADKIVSDTINDAYKIRLDGYGPNARRMFDDIKSEAMKLDTYVNDEQIGSFVENNLASNRYSEELLGSDYGVSTGQYKIKTEVPDLMKTGDYRLRAGGGGQGSFEFTGGKTFNAPPVKESLTSRLKKSATSAIGDSIKSLLKPETTEPTATPYYGGGFDYGTLGATQYGGTDITGSQGGELVAKVYGDNAANRMKTYYKNMNLIADGATFI